MAANLNTLMVQLGYEFSDLGLLEAALTHRSFQKNNNERLEFLGDSILNFIIADILYHRFPDINEGKLSIRRAYLVRSETLAKIAVNIALGEHLKLGAGELKSGGKRRQSILEDSVEAILAAVYLDGGIEASKQVVQKLFNPIINSENLDDASIDAKTALQELAQSKGLPLPIYQVVKSEGEAHAQTFTVSCTIKKLNLQTSGQGTSKRRAEQIAASHLLKKIYHDSPKNV